MIEYKFIGWCKEDNHDKVWGVIDIGNHRCVTFWGRRGKKLQTKISDFTYEIHRLIQTKINKGYIRIDKSKLDKVYPEFEDDLEKTAVMAILKN
jgi:predicted DNA-binding WGR domain protein